MARAQEAAYFNITQQQGLPSNTVYDLLQDSTGYLWVATENGLARYNGTQFRYYENQTLRSAAVSGLKESKDGTLWLHNFSGEVLFVNDDTLQQLASWEERYSEGFPALSAFDGQLLISTSDHIYSYQLKSGNWSRLDSVLYRGNAKVYFASHSVMHGNPFAVYSTLDTSYVTGLPGEKYVLPHRQYPLSINVLRLTHWKNKLMLFDAYRHQLLELSGGEVKDVSANFGDLIASTREIKNIGDSLLAFIGTNGVHLLNRKSEWTRLLAGRNVSSIASDREGSLWVGTLNEGLFYFPHLQSKVFEKGRHPLYTTLLSDAKTQRLYAGGFNGSVRILDDEGNVIDELNTPQNKEVQSLFIDASNDQLLVFTDKLYWYRLSSRQLVRTLGLPAVKKIIQVKDQYALATSDGLIFINSHTGEKKQAQVARQRITTLCHDSVRNRIWIGAQKELIGYSLEENRVIVEDTEWKGKPLGVSSMVMHNQLLLAGTRTNGLLVLHDGKITKHFTTERGLPSDHITSLHLHDGVLWIGTDRGIASLNLRTMSMSAMDETKGLTAEEIYDITTLGPSLWVSHPQGLQYFNSIPARNKQQPVLQLAAASSHGVEQKNPERGIELQPPSQQLTLQFDVANNLRARGKTQIYYRIKELDGDQWNTTSLQTPVANYQFLPFGRFTFEAYAVNEDNIRSAGVVTVPLRVIAPVWKRTWFIAVCMCGGLMAVGAVLYLRVKELDRRKRVALEQQNQEQELRIAQLTSLRAQMNPHFIFNTMSLIQGNVLNANKDEANEQIQLFSFLLRKTLDLSGKEMILLQEEVEVLEKYLAIEKDRFDGQLEYHIDVDETLKHEMIRIPSLLTQPFVENALRHGLMHKEGLKKLTIRFALEHDRLIIHIRDNGVGRAASAEFNKARRKDHQSFAIEAYRKRLDLLNKSFKNKIELKIEDHYHDNRTSAGTSVIISIPLNYEPAAQL